MVVQQNEQIPSFQLNLTLHKAVSQWTVNHFLIKLCSRGRNGYEMWTQNETDRSTC